MCTQKYACLFANYITDIFQLITQYSTCAHIFLIHQLYKHKQNPFTFTVC